MARKIVWSEPAEKDRQDILGYWLKRNGTPAYSLKLFARFNQVIERIKSNPFMGRPSDIIDVRVLPVGDYLLFYEVLADAILIHHIWDGRRDTSKLKF